MHKSIATMSFLAALLAPGAGPSAAAEFGTAAEARALLTRAIVEVKINRTAALAKFNRADGGFNDRDLYVFCFDGQDGKITANATRSLIGQNVRSMRDVNGTLFGDAMFRDAKQDVVKTFAYMWPRPGDAKPVAKESFVTRIGGDACGVGYYK